MPKQSKWEEKFDTKFPILYAQDYDAKNYVKQFISDLLAERDKQWLDVIEDGTSIDDILFKAKKLKLID